MRECFPSGGPTKPCVALFVICALLACMPMVGEVSATTPRTVDIAPNSYLAIQFTGSSTVPSSYQITVVSGPNIDVILTNLSGYVEYLNGGLDSISYSPLGTCFDTRTAAYYGDLSNDTYCLIIDNTDLGTAQPNGQSVRLTYSYGAGGAGIPPRSDLFSSLYGFLLIGGAILLIALVAIIAWKKVAKRSQAKHSPVPFLGKPFLGKHGNDSYEDVPSDQTFFDPRKPHRVYPQAEAVIRPVMVRAIGRCPECNGIIAKEWTQCRKCGWSVDRSKLRPFK